MAEFPAINTSPLIFLSKANLTNLLQIISSKIIVPEAVAREIQAYGEADITAHTLATTNWLIVQSVPQPNTNISMLGFVPQPNLQKHHFSRNSPVGWVRRLKPRL